MLERLGEAAGFSEGSMLWDSAPYVYRFVGSSQLGWFENTVAENVLPSRAARGYRRDERRSRRR